MYYTLLPWRRLCYSISVRLWPRFGRWIRVQEGKNDPQEKEKSEEILSFEVLDVLSGGLKAFPVAWTPFMKA
jgi:hypothetical protein